MARRYRNEIERQYFRERDRIRKALERMERRGILQRGAMSNKEIMPKIPKRITRGSVSRLQKMTTASLYKNAELIDYDTGEILALGKNIKRVERERRRAQARGQQYEPAQPPISARKVSTAQLIFDNLVHDISNMGSSLTSYMISELYALVERLGVGNVAKIIEGNAEELHDIIDKGTGQYNRKVVEPLARRFDLVLRKGVSKSVFADSLTDPNVKIASMNLRTAANSAEWGIDGEE